MSKKPIAATPPPQTFKANPFAGLHLDLPAPVPPVAPAAPAAPPTAAKGPLSKADRELLHAMGGDAEIGVGRDKKPKVSFHFERKGRGGKAVTVIRGLERLTSEEQMAICDQVKKALGTGAWFEEERLVIQGDQVLRGRAWFDAQGFRVS